LNVSATLAATGRRLTYTSGGGNCAFAALSVAHNANPVVKRLQLAELEKPAALRARHAHGCRAEDLRSAPPVSALWTRDNGGSHRVTRASSHSQPAPPATHPPDWGSYADFIKVSGTW
jgi:hypothetical protein